jgi:hypothetical protein
MISAQRIIELAHKVDPGAKLSSRYGDDDMFYHICLSNKRLVHLHIFGDDEQLITKTLEDSARAV